MSSTTPSNKLERRFWRVVSNVKLNTFLTYMKLECLFGKITESDLQMLIDSPGIMADVVFLDALRALRNNLTDAKTLGEDMSFLFQMGLIPTNYTPNLLYTLRGVVKSEITQETFSVRAAKKFSGYVRNSSSVGSKRKGNLSIPEPETGSWANPDVIDFFYFFSVGELNMGQPGSSKLALKSPSRTKRNPNNAKT